MQIFSEIFYLKTRKMKITGEKIKDYRLKNSLTQERLAEILGISKRTIINYEKGEKIPETKSAIFHKLFAEDHIIVTKKENTSRYTIKERDRISDEVVNDWDFFMGNERLRRKVYREAITLLNDKVKDYLSQES